MKPKKLIVLGGILVIAYKIGKITGCKLTHYDFVKRYGDVVFEKRDCIISSITEHTKIITWKKENGQS